MGQLIAREKSVRHTISALACVLAANVLPATQAAAETLPGSIRACAAVADPTDRLACFDRAVAAAGAPTAAVPAAAPATHAAAATTATASTTVAAPALTPEQQFGASPELQRQKQPQTDPAKPKPLDKLTAAVTAVRSLSTGVMILTLDNGQVWRQVEPAVMQVKPGDPVTIKPASFGSFWMMDPSGRGCRVKRTQ